MISRRYNVKSELDIKIDKYFNFIDILRDMMESVIGFKLIEYKEIESSGIRYGRFIFYHDISISVFHSKY